ncbi:MAG TPA: DUF4142 domain-containing protein [Chitinophagaceae bacterium]|nr:DUF4142 domain-containing protein [Chitinophagaceae bacterium]
MRTKNTLVLIVIASLGFAACDNSSNTSSAATDSTGNTSSNMGANAAGADSKSGATTGKAGDSANAAPSAAPDTADIAFVRKAASGGMLEVQLGNMAASNGMSPSVKKFGEMMITDHTQANTNLKTIAQQLQINLSDSLLPAHAHHKQMLSAAKGSAFDKAYMKMMVEDHKEDIADFQKASNSKNSMIKNFASETLPVLNKHLDSATAIAGRIKK